METWTHYAVLHWFAAKCFPSTDLVLQLAMTSFNKK